MFCKNPVFSVIVLVTLALGIAANTAVFSVVSAIFLRPLPGIADPDALVSLYRIQNGLTIDNMGYPDYRDYRDHNHTLRGLAAHSPVAANITYGAPERVICDRVTGNYFDLLGVRPALGRLLRDDDDSAAVISHSLWERKFGSSDDAIGVQIQLNGYPFTIVGVADRLFRGTMVSLPLDLWVPLKTQLDLGPGLSSSIMENRAAGWLFLFGRLKPGIGVAQAGAEIRTIANQLSQVYPVTNAKRTAVVAAGVGIYPDDRAEVSGLLALLAAAVALLLLIACANVAGMLLLRAMGRTREIAIRLASGATRKRLVAQLLTEGFVLAAMAGTIGVFLASWATQAIIARSQGTARSLIRHAGARIDGKVLAFTLLATCATGLLIALAPATQSLKVDLTSSLKAGLPGAGFRRTHLRSALVVAQVALSLVLLSSAGLILHSLYRVLTTNPGFDAANIGMATVDLSLQQYPQERNQAFYRELLSRLRATPGLVAASLASSVPPTEFPGAASLFHPGEEPPPELLQGRDFELGTRANIVSVAPDYFRTLQIPILQGRDFSDRDRAGAPGVVIVSRKLAEKMWPGKNPVGKQVAYPLWQGSRRPPFEVVGVAADVKHIALTRDAPLLLYVPVAQESGPGLRVVVRSASGAHAGIALIRQAVAETDKNVPVYFPQTGAEHLSDSLWQQRMAASWIAAFSVMALLLAAVGLYMVIAQSVAQRTREVGIRMALGANRTAVAALVIRQGIRLVLAGIAVGVPAASVLSTLMLGHLEGLGPGDPVSLAAFAALLLLIMLVACWVPAHRAACIDPIEALRAE